MLYNWKYECLLALNDEDWLWLFKHAVVDCEILEKHNRINPPYFLGKPELQEILSSNKPLGVKDIPLLLQLKRIDDEQISKTAHEKLCETPLGAMVCDILGNDSRPKLPAIREGHKKKREKIDFDVIWQEFAKEEKRGMVNVKLKIVLREIPEKVKEVDKMILLPLENQAKGVPGGMQLPNTPINLMVGKKMWKNAKKKADALLEETKLNPIYVIEALIGFKDNQLAAIASSVIVTKGKESKK